ncbi:transcription factor TFIIIB component B'' homolog isoform X2 [Hoplias malabaricus]|uniref:transcription factor TFIIIB component B'' homolog isoform X2 n=1 Tax=Hoplias malabaricus TaxID=27720 RepID=UPI003462D831
MIRRSRISVKPNIRPGGRSDPAGEQPSKTPEDADNSQPTVTAGELVKPFPSPQRKTLVEESAERSAENSLNSPLESSSADLNNGAPSSGTTTLAAVPLRRMRITATPKLVRPKATSATQPSTRIRQTVPSPLPKEIAVQNTTSVSGNSDHVSESSTSGTTAPTEEAKQPSPTHTPSSPCVPSISGPVKPPVHESTEDSPPSPQPGQVPQQPPHEPEPQKYPTSKLAMPSVCVKLSRVDEPGALEKEGGTSSDKEKILRALKLKELMKIERRRDIQSQKKFVRRKPEDLSVDRSKMTMRDLIYYLPNTSPMRGSTVGEGNQEEADVPPSPKQPEKTPEWEEDEEEHEDEEVLVPKVRVAEDGSIILDEESLTVRVQKSSNTKVVENSNPLFERGSTTTYSSFRKLPHVKTWSIRETDMFFLAISMVGTDFSLIGQLLPHRSRAEIKNKFKKEEKQNGWRIDKAFQNKRPYDREFFSYLLEKILAKDKKKGKSVRLVMTKPRKHGKTKDKKSQEYEEECLSDYGGDEDLEDGDYIDVEKENECLPHMNKADNYVPAKKKRKRKSDDHKDEGDLSEEQGKRKKKTKRTRRTKNDVQSPEGDAEGESGLLNTNRDPVNVDQEQEMYSSKSAPQKKRKRSKKAEEEPQDEASVEGSKCKRRKKSLKGSNNSNKPKDSIGADEGKNGVDEDGGFDTKRRRSPKGDLKEDTQANEKKRKKQAKAKSKKVTAEDQGTAENGEPSVTVEAEEVNKIDSPVPLEVMDNVPKRSAKRPKKTAPNLAARRRKKPAEAEMTAGEIQESQCENNSEGTQEGEVNYLKAEQLQKRAVVVLERTPPRVQNQSNESEAPVTLPASPVVSESSSDQKRRKQRAERAKRSLTTVNKKGKGKVRLDQEGTEPDPGATANQSPTALLKQMVVQESQDSEAEAESSIEDNLIDYSCLQHLESQMFQRKPMVVLSREEVHMILNDQDRTSEDDPSVSPLDLSLNTELSFQLQCSNLMEENSEAVEVESVVEELGDISQQMSSSSVALEKCCKDMELTTEPGLGQSDMPTPRNMSGLSSEVSSHSAADKLATSSPLKSPEHLVNPNIDKAKDPEASQPQVVLDTVDSEGDVPVTNKTLSGSFPEFVIHDAFLASSTTVVEPKADFLLTPEIQDGSQESISASTEVFVKSQESVVMTPEIQGSVLKTLESKDEPQRPEEGSPGSVMASAEIKEGSQGSVEGVMELKAGSQSSVSSATEIKADNSTLAVPEIKEKSPGPMSVSLEIQEKPVEPIVPEPVIIEDSQEEDLLQSLPTASEIVKESDCVVVTPEIKPGSQESILDKQETLDRSMEDAPVKEDSTQQVTEEALTPSSTLAPSISVPSEHGCVMKRRSRFPRSKPNLRLASKITHISLQKKDTEHISSEKILPQSPGKNQRSDSEDANKERLSNEEEKPKSCAVDIGPEPANQSIVPGFTSRTEVPKSHSGSKTISDPLLCGGSSAVLEQENISTAALKAASSEEPQLVTGQLDEVCHMDSLPLGASVFEDLQTVDTSYSELYAPAKIIQPAEDVSGDEEPTVILTLYEIPVTEAYSASASNISVMTSQLLLTDQPSISSPSVSHSDFMSMETGEVQKECVDISQNELFTTLGTETEEETNKLSVIQEKHLAGPAEEHSQNLVEVTTPQTITPQAKDEDTNICMKLESEGVSDNKDSAKVLPDLKPQYQSTPFTVRVSKRMSPLAQDSEDSEKCEGVSHITLASVFLPVSEVGDDLTKDSAYYEEIAKEKYTPSVSNSSFTVAVDSKDEPSLSEETAPYARWRDKLQPNLVTSLPSSSQAALPNLQQTSAAQENQDSVSAELQLSPESKESTSSDPSKGKNLGQKHHITPCTFSISQCVGSVPQDSHMVPASAIVPDDSTESTPSDNGACIPNRKDSSETTLGRASASQEIKPPIRRRGKLQVKPNLRGRASIKTESPKLPQGASSQIISATSKKPELEEEDCKTSGLLTEEVRPKSDKEPSSEVKECSSMAYGGFLNPSHETAPFSVMMSTSYYSENTEEDCVGVSHMVLTDIFVPVSEEMGNDLSKDWLMSLECGSNKEEEAHDEKKKKPVSNGSITAFRKNDQDELQEERTNSKTDSCTEKLEKGNVFSASELDVEAKVSSAQDSSTEEELQKRRQIIPCTVRVSRCTDSLPLGSEEIKGITSVSHMVLTEAKVPVSEVKDLSKDLMQVQKSAISSPSKESRKPSVIKGKKSPAKSKGKLLVKFPFAQWTVKKNASSKSLSYSGDAALKSPQIGSKTHQQTLTAWLKKESNQIGMHMQPVVLCKRTQMETNETSLLDPAKTEDLQTTPHLHKTSACSKPELTHSENVSKGVSHICLVPSTEKKMEPENKEDSNGCSSGSQMSKSPVRQREAKLQRKPTISKQTIVKNEENSSDGDQPRSVQLSSPTRPHTRAAAREQESDKMFTEQSKDAAHTSKVEVDSGGKERSLTASDSQSPRLSTLWPRVVLPRLKVQTPGAGFSSDSSTPTSSPVRISKRTSQPRTSPQRRKSPRGPNEQGPSTSSEDEPSKVSQFFLCDIFTEVEDED